MEAGMILIKPSLSLLPERQNEYASVAQEDKATVGVLGFPRYLKTEHFPVKLFGTIQITDIQTDMSCHGGSCASRSHWDSPFHEKV
jgi:hypothetical protein